MKEYGTIIKKIEIYDDDRDIFSIQKKIKILPDYDGKKSETEEPIYTIYKDEIKMILNVDEFINLLKSMNNLRMYNPAFSLKKNKDVTCKTTL